jgi:O-antigen/teichoic acid export membrane protein
MRTFSNLAFGILGSATTAVATIIMTPVYLHYLGVEAYALIGFYMTMLMCVQVLDAGMSTSLSKQVALARSQHLEAPSLELLRVLMMVYAGFSVVISAIFFLAAPLIAKKWLVASSLDASMVEQAIQWLGLSIAFRMPMTLFLGALTGTNRLATSGVLMMFWSIVNASLSYAMLTTHKWDIVNFFQWQALLALLQTTTACVAAHYGAVKLDWTWPKLALFLQHWKFSGAVGAISLIGLILSQMDKIILSKTIPLASFGYYMLATSVAGSLYIFIGPIFNLIFPRLSHIYAEGQDQPLIRRYSNYTGLMVTAVIPLALFLCLSAETLIFWWTNDKTAATFAAPLAQVLLVAICTHAVMYLPYALALAAGVTRPYIYIYMALLFLMFPLILLLSRKLGAIGGAYSQLMLYIVYFCLGTWATHRLILRAYVWRWICGDVFMPVLMAGAIAYVSFFALQAYAASPKQVILVAFTAALTTAAACAWNSFIRLRSPIKSSFNKLDDNLSG